jgi:hypothetical protein
MMRTVERLLLACGTEESILPPTELFNEGWLLRLALEQLAGREFAGQLLSPMAGGRWFSEGLLPSQFLARKRGDALAEGWTHADGVVGHFDVSWAGRSEITLAGSAAQFVVVEAKLGSPLSAGTTRAPFYNQAARNIACIAEVLHRAGAAPRALESVCFLVVAPACQIGSAISGEILSKVSVQATVEKRVAMYVGTPDELAKRAWFERAFLPLLDVIRIETITWEAIVDCIAQLTPEAAPAFQEFYARCLQFNRVPPPNKALNATVGRGRPPAR